MTFLIIFKFDSKSSATILELLKNVKIRLNNSIAHRFIQKYCDAIQNTKEDTNKAN